MKQNRVDQYGTVGIIGAGHFGTALAFLMSKNRKVLMYTRQEENIVKINEEHQHSYLGYKLPENIRATSNIEFFCQECELIFPVLPSSIFRQAIKQFAPFLSPAHILIHGTKGFDVDPQIFEREDFFVDRKELNTMSEIIEQETQVIRIGCLAGPNLSAEIMESQPTATVIASKYQEVIDRGKVVLRSDVFRVFESFEIRGAELAGAFKNIIAIGTGIMKGKGYGKNLQAMVITKGLSEIIYLGKSLDIEPSIFLGTAGLGDLIATATSEKSRNFSFGLKLGSGLTIAQIKEDSEDLAEGVRTIKIAYGLQKKLKLKLPIITLLYRLVYEDYSLDEAMRYLMSFPFDIDVDFLN